MRKEIERKFKVINNGYKEHSKGELYRQGYLSTHFERVVRVRTAGGKGYLTIKGANTGAIRKEFEYEIPLNEACEMLENLCQKPIIEKYRYKVHYKGFVWEIDEFLGENEGLVLAEIELQHECQSFCIPDWIGEEVTGDIRYYNSNLLKNPYNRWSIV